VGILCARPELLEELRPDKLRPSPDVAPDRWELGTLPFEALAGVRAAADYVAGIDWDDVRTHEDALLAAALDGLGVNWSARDDLAKVSVIGAGMKSHPGVAAKTFETLDELGIDVEVVTTSPIKIACHVKSNDVERAVQGLHAAFELDASSAERAHA
jgi:aspartate kinase